MKEFIRPSSSPFSSPIILVNEKNRDLRIDFRKLNKQTIRDHYPLPLISLINYETKKYFTCLDLKNGVYHIRMAEDNIKYTYILCNTNGPI